MDTTIASVLAQAPLHTTSADAEKALKDTSGSIGDAITMLWNIPKPLPKDTSHMEYIRNLCDDFDSEVEKYLKTMISK